MVFLRLRRHELSFIKGQSGPPVGRIRPAARLGPAAGKEFPRHSFGDRLPRYCLQPQSRWRESWRFLQLPTAPLPQVDFPTISVSAALPGASPDIMASAVAAPLERQFAHMAGLTEMTSASYLGFTSITLQFDLSRNIDGAARDVQATINAARANLPSTFRKIPPGEKLILPMRRS